MSVCPTTERDTAIEPDKQTDKQTSVEYFMKRVTGITPEQAEREADKFLTDNSRNGRFGDIRSDADFMTRLERWSSGIRVEPRVGAAEHERIPRASDMVLPSDKPRDLESMLGGLDE